jgi:hypothetical protein
MQRKVITIDSGLQPAINALTPGDTLIVAPGIYRERCGDLKCKGTESAPIRIIFEEGAIVRGTRFVPAADMTPVGGNVYRFPCPFDPFRVVQLDPWEPIRVTDPVNKSTFVLEEPALMEKVSDPAVVLEVPGCFSYELPTQGTPTVLAHLFCPLGEGIEVGQQYDGTISIRTQYTDFSGLRHEYANGCQWYRAVRTALFDTTLVASPLVMVGTASCQVNRLRVENVITRGETHEWHHHGGGTAITVTDDCLETTIENVATINNWNGGGFGGTHTTLRNIQCCNAPNHGIGLGMIGGRCSQLGVWNTQEGLWITTLIDTVIEDSYLSGATAAYLYRSCSNVAFRNNVIASNGMKILPDSIANFQSNWNVFLMAARLDYRYNNVRADSIAEVREKFGLEMNSIQITDPAMSLGALRALRGVTDLTKQLF